MDFNREHHVDLRVQKTREAIKNTFKEMICEMPAEKITVKELTDRARIHRKTFYLHYTTIVIPLRRSTAFSLPITRNRTNL